MCEMTSLRWGMQDMPLPDGDLFALARSSCLDAVQVARDVSIDNAALKRFALQLDVGAIRNILEETLGENCDTLPDEFRNERDAVNFALLFALLQFGHGFRYELHRLCGRGASKTITLGMRALNATGELSAARLRRLTKTDVRQMFQLPDDSALVTLVQQLHTVLHQAGAVLQSLALEDFAAFARRALTLPEASLAPAATLVRQLTDHFPAFNDQGRLHNGARVVLLKKAALAVGELRRLAAIHAPLYLLSQDFHRVVAPIDNVIPAMLVYQGVLRLSPGLRRKIHQPRGPLARGSQEAELRAVALAACEQIVAAVGEEFTALNLGYYLWRSGKEAKARRYPRHHTRDTVFY
jgi:hypothetical protein